ncbi:MAG: DUF975 family protein [Opitutales bacterium]
MSWYYEKNNEQNGPVSEEELMSLYRRGVIEGRNLVWRDGMADWATLDDTFPGLSGGAGAGEVSCPSCGASVGADRLIPAGERQACPFCKDEFARGMPGGLSRPVRRAGPRGTGGQTPNAELRSLARDSLAGGWGMAVLVVLLFQLIQQAGAFVPIIGQLVAWLIAGPLTLGLMAYFVGLHRGEPVEVGTLFSGFSRFMQGLGLYVVTTLLISLAALAAAVPGIMMVVLAYESSPMPEESPLLVAGIVVAVFSGALVGLYMYLRYALVYFIANDYPELGVMGAIKRSVEMMAGRKGKFFMLGLSFIGWHFLGMLALGIGLLWSLSYMWAAFAAFYEDIGEEAWIDGGLL